MRCHGCGVAKDMTAPEVYPWAAEDGLHDGPIRPLLAVNVDDRTATVCHACFHRLSPDVWVGREAWEAIDPATRYDDLPMG